MAELEGSGGRVDRGRGYTSVRVRHSALSLPCIENLQGLAPTSSGGGEGTKDRSQPFYRCHCNSRHMFANCIRFGHYRAEVMGVLFQRPSALQRAAGVPGLPTMGCSTNMRKTSTEFLAGFSSGSAGSSLDSCVSTQRVRASHGNQNRQCGCVLCPSVPRRWWRE